MMRESLIFQQCATERVLLPLHLLLHYVALLRAIIFINHEPSCLLAFKSPESCRTAQSLCHVRKTYRACY